MRYLLYYAGFNDKTGEEQIGVAESKDFISWSYVGRKPVVPLKSQGVYDEDQTSNPCVLKQNGVYKMWYQGKSKKGLISICYAESKNGLDWESAKDPVLFPNESFSEGLYREGLHHPHVIFDESEKVFKMWCVSSRNGITTICYTESVNGLVWNTLGSTSLKSDTAIIKLWYPCVLKNEGTYRIWYTKRLPNKEWRIYHAESLDGLDWKETVLPIVQNASFKLTAILFEAIAKYLDINIKRPFYGIGSPYVWKEAGKYKLLGHEVGVMGKLYIPLYESLDGIYWNKVKNNILPVSSSEWNRFFQADPYLYVE